MFDSLRYKFNRTHSNTIPVIKFHGTIADGEDNINIHSKKSEIDRVFATSPDVIFVSINSPGGLPTQSALIHDYVRRKADKQHVKVYVFIEDFGASGGYWLATMGDIICCSETSLVGSIGVIGSGFGFNKLLEKYGIERRKFTSGKAKAIADPFSELTQEDKDFMDKLLTSMHELFIDHVKSRRPKIDESVFDARVVIGKEAIQLGLVDSNMDMYETLEKHFSESILVSFAEKSWFKKFSLKQLLFGGEFNISSKIPLAMME